MGNTTAIKTNRVYGARGVGAENSNVNSSFQGLPNTLSNGQFFNSDVSTKWADRDFWKSIGYDVLVKTSYVIDKDGNPVVQTIDDVVAAKTNAKESLLKQVLNNFVDTACFGAVMALKKKNISTTGPIQYNIGVNKLEDCTDVKVHDILSPYKNSNKKAEDASRATIGKSSFIERALYVQGFSVCPEQANSLVELVNDEEFKGFKEEYYLAFKKATLCSITRLNSRAKIGARDEFAIFINMKEDSYYALPNIASLIEARLDEEGNKSIVNFDNLAFLNNLDDVDSIEIYYNGAVCDIEHSFTNAYIWDTTKGFKLREEV